MERLEQAKIDVFPVIRAGNQQELMMLCEELEIPNEETSQEEEWVKTVRNGTAIGWKKAIEGQDIVPDVKGMTFRDALFLLEKSGLRVFYEGKGRVQSQSLNPGARVRKGDGIYVRLG